MSKWVNPKLALTRLNYFQLLFNESDFILEFKKGLNKYRTSASQILNEIYEKLKLKLFCWHCKEWKIGLKVSHETQMLMILDSNFFGKHVCIGWYTYLLTTQRNFDSEKTKILGLTADFSTYVQEGDVLGDLGTVSREKLLN